MKSGGLPFRLVKVVVTIAFVIGLIFIPAGTLKWPEAWIVLFFYGLVVTGILLWWKRNAPDLLRERMTPKKEAKSWDKILMRTYTFLLLFLLALPGLDAVRFGWSNVPSFVKILGFLGYLPAIALALWAIKENAFLSDVVRIQKDRGHTVCTTGPYRYIRHPMYTGVILVFICFPLSLGSLYSFIPAALIIFLFLIRTALEDKTLQKELPGYTDYAERVRYRLIPGVW